MNKTFFVGWLALVATHLSAVEIIGHRGASYDAPENTLASFRLGWQQKADADELDIYLTKDGRIIVIHDNNTKRTAARDAAVKSQTLEELRALDAGTWKGVKRQGERLPALAEALQTIPDGKRMFIEIKSGPEVLPELQRVIESSGKQPEQLVLIGFSYGTMQKAKQRFPKLECYWIVGADKKSKRFPAVDSLIKQARAAKLDGLDLHYKFPMDSGFVAQVKAAGLKLYVWTCDDPAAAARLAGAGVDGITTNRPGWLREQLQAAPK